MLRLCFFAFNAKNSLNYFNEILDTKKNTEPLTFSKWKWYTYKMFLYPCMLFEVKVLTTLSTCPLP